MFRDKKLTHELVVAEAIKQYRPPPRRQFPKMIECNGMGDPIDHYDKYESLMTGMGHCDIMFCKMLKTYEGFSNYVVPIIETPINQLI